MELIDRLKVFRDKGFYCDYNKGFIYSNKGKLLNRKNKKGYIQITCRQKLKVYQVMAHQFIYWMYHNEVPITIDHIDNNKSNNIISNLRNVDYTQNNLNTDRVKLAKGTYYNGSKYIARIQTYKKNINLGYFETEDEAKQAYLEAKKLYH